MPCDRGVPKIPREGRPGEEGAPPRGGSTGNGSLLLPWLVGARGGVTAAG